MPTDGTAARTIPPGTQDAAWMRAAWQGVLLLWPVALLNYLDRQMLAAMKFSVMADIPDLTTDAQWGLMLGQFKWMYALLSPIGGWVADRCGHRITIACSLFAWSAVTWATGSATTASEMMWTRTLMGVSEAFYIPAALALISQWHGPPTRSRAVALHQSAIYVGIMAGGFGGHVADAPMIGWRGAFHACGIVGMLYALPLVLLLRRSAAQLRIEATTEQPRVGTALRELLCSVPFLLLVACFTLPALAGWVVRDWMPAVLKEQFRIGQGTAGVSATLYTTLGMMAGVVLGGWLADRWSRTTGRGRAWASCLGLLVLVPALFGVGNAATLVQAIVFLAVFGIGWGCFDCNNMPILSQLVRPQYRATGYGIMNLVSISCGGLADWVFGALRDAGTPLNGIFAAFALFALLAAGLMGAIALGLPKEPQRAAA